MADSDVDLYGDDFNPDGDYNNGSNIDIYDDVINSPSDDHRNDEGRHSSIDGLSPSSSRHAGKRVAVYVGNLTWWTTDKDITDTIKSLGVNDLLQLKFYENRANGQSKGFCVVALGSEASLRIVMEKLPKKELHGQSPVVTSCTRQNLNYFESQSRKGGHGSGNRHDGSNERRPRDRERERDNRDSRSDGRNMQQDRSRSRSNPNQSYHHQQQQQQRMIPGSHMQPLLSAPPPAQYQPGPGHTPWMSGPPPQIQHMPPPPIRPGAPPVNAGAPPLPPGLQAPPPIRPGPPPNNMGVPPPRGPPPMGPRNLPPPDTRGPPPAPEWDRHLSHPPPPHHVTLPPQHVGPPNRPPMSVPPPVPGLPPAVPPPGPPVPSPHINPNFFHQQGVPPRPAPSSQGGDPYNPPPPVQFSDYRSSSDRGLESSSPAISDAEFEETMARNRTVSSSAISRAVADASAADFASAIETLVTAISLIKQSKVASDERCKILISSLQDTLHGIESKSYGSRSKERPRSRERERSRERSSRREKSSRRDRSRSRDREYRDRSRERDRYHDDRYRDKDRDHDRDRRSSRH